MSLWTIVQSSSFGGWASGDGPVICQFIILKLQWQLVNARATVFAIVQSSPSGGWASGDGPVICQFIIFKASVAVSQCQSNYFWNIRLQARVPSEHFISNEELRGSTPR